MDEGTLYSLPKDYQLKEYQILRVLGEGGFGITYLAFDTKLEKAVAIKEYYPPDLAARRSEFTVSPKTSNLADGLRDGLQDFIREAQILGQFRHPNIVQVYRYIEANDTAYIVMEYVEGAPLSKIRAESGPLSFGEWMAWLLPLLDGLKQVHRLNYLHRDIKLGNILVRADEHGDSTPVLVDFGAARQAISSQTRELTSILTPGYAPIEQYSQRPEKQGPFTDVYAMAMVSYRMLTDQELISATDRAGVDEMPALSQLLSGQAPTAQLEALDWGLRVWSKDRPQDVDEWLQALSGGERIVSEPEAVAQPHSPSVELRTVMPVRRTSRRATFYVAGSLVVAALGAVGWYAYEESRLQEELEADLAACEPAGPDYRLPITCYRALVSKWPDEQRVGTELDAYYEIGFERVRAKLEQNDYEWARGELRYLRGAGANPETIDAIEIRAIEQERAWRVAQTQSAIDSGNYTQAEALLARAKEAGADSIQTERMASAISQRRAERGFQQQMRRCKEMSSAGNRYAAFTCLQTLGAEYPGRNQPNVEQRLIVDETRTLASQAINNGRKEASSGLIAEAKSMGGRVDDLGAAFADRFPAPAPVVVQRQQAKSQPQDRAVQPPRARSPAPKPVLEIETEVVSLPSDGAVYWNITRVNGDASSVMGLQTGDQIVRVGSERLRATDTVTDLIINPISKPDGNVRLRYERGNKPFSIYCENRKLGLWCNN